MSEPDAIVEYPFVKCPFCGEEDFDLPGLKFHFTCCQAYANVETLGHAIFNRP